MRYDEIEYGMQVTDTLTGYAGKVTAKASYFGKSANRVLLESIDTTGRPCEWWCDAERVKVIGA